MKSTICMLVILVTLAHSTKLESKIDSNEFQEIMEDFVEVHKTANQAQNIGQLLTKIKLSITQNQKNYESFIKTFQKSCENAKSKLAKFVKRLNHQIKRFRNKVNSLSAEAKFTERKRSETSVNLKTTNERLEKLEKEQTQLILDYHAGAAESDERIIAVKDLQNQIIDNLANQDYTGTNFVEIKTKITEKLHKLQNLVMKTGGSLETQVLSSLVDLASEHNFSDQSILKKILKLLRKLQSKLEEYRKQKENDITVTLENYKSQVENLQSQINEYVHLGQRYISTIAEAHHNIAILESDIKDLTSEIARKNSETLTLNKLCVDEDKLFNKLIDSSRKIVLKLSSAAGQALKL